MPARDSMPGFRMDNPNVGIKMSLSLTCFIRAGPYLESFFTDLVKVILGLISRYRVHESIQSVLFHTFSVPF